MGELHAVGLVSGGLDGTLAVRLLEDQGVVVHAVHVSTGFAREDAPGDLACAKARNPAANPYDPSFQEAAGLRGSFEIVDVAADYFESVVLRPKYGYGSALNPCIDCRIFMLRKAEAIRKERGAQLVCTGEVLGQDAMSQKRAALRTIEEEAGLGGTLLRPLSARLLEPTTLEQEGKIDRSRLGRLNGRSRGGQEALARSLGLQRIPTPRTGCCLLSDAGYARRLRDLIAHRDTDSLRRDDFVLLRVGRHLRLAHDLKVILGRDEAESAFLLRRAEGRWTCQVASKHGSFGVLDGTPDPDRFEAVASLAARYSRERGQARIEVLLRRGSEEKLVATAAATDAGRLVV